MNPDQRHAAPPFVVLDTNVILDWLVFHNPGVTALVGAIESARLCWLMDTSIRAEVAHVLQRKPWRAHPVDETSFWQAVDRFARCEPVSTPPVVAHGMACRDADDQKFIDLALVRGAQWLISRDRAVLALARRAKRSGLTITTPERWSAMTSIVPTA